MPIQDSVSEKEIKQVPASFFEENKLDNVKFCDTSSYLYHLLFIANTPKVYKWHNLTWSVTYYIYLLIHIYPYYIFIIQEDEKELQEEEEVVTPPEELESANQDQTADAGETTEGKAICLNLLGVSAVLYIESRLTFCKITYHN